ncbi:hypothetical protein ABZ249_11965 [Nocardiopsis sp. NPDC006139]|uniref:hypothetical protein n=1 Tax=Nocardiopsis sp. NPDC006139 TaxID=3154578 RepID=UPI0033B214DA
MPTLFRSPLAMFALTEEATRLGRSYSVTHDVDSGGAPYVTVRVWWKRPEQDTPVEIRAVWHTRPTSTYRLKYAMARWPGQDWTDVSVTRAQQLLADGTDLEPPPEQAPDPAQEWARVWCDPYLAGDLGARLTCEETEVVADLLSTLGMPRQALAWLVEHAQGDDEGDSHWELRQKYPNGYE